MKQEGSIQDRMIELVNTEQLTAEEISDSIDYWELYAWEAARKQDRKEYEKAKGHVKAMQELLRSSSEPLTDPARALREAQPGYSEA